MKNTEQILAHAEADQSKESYKQPYYEHRTRRIKGPNGLMVDSLLAVFDERLTYTFIDRDSVASIHFDRKRQEIFYRGHNIRNMKLGLEQRHILTETMLQVLRSDERAREYLQDYQATLAKVLADNK